MDTLPATGAKPRHDGLSRGVCLSFGIGTVGTAVLLNTVTVYLPAFVTTVLGRSVALAGLLLTISKLYDVLCDLAIGLASDRTRSRMGRRRPYLLAGAVVGSLTFASIFNAPLLDGNALVWEMAALLIVYSTGYSLFNVPYLAIPPELAGSYDGRTRLLSYRTAFVSVGQFIAFSVSAWMLHALGGGRHGYAVMGATLACVIAATELATFLGLRDALPPPPLVAPARSSVWTSMRSVLGNGPFGLLMGAKFAQLLGVSTAVSTSLLFMLNVLQVGYLGQANFSIAQNAAIALSMPAWVRVSRRIGKRRTAMGAVVIYAAGSLSWLLAGPGEPTLGIVLRGLAIGVGAGGILLMGTSMLADAMEYDAHRTGQRQEGIYSSAFAIVEKGAFAVGPGLIGLVLSWAGYVPTQLGRLVAQPGRVVQALYLGAAVLPAAMMAASLVFLWFYRLDATALERLRRS